MPRRFMSLLSWSRVRYWPPCHERQQKSRARACIGRRHNTSVAGGPSLWRHLVGLANWSSSHRPCETSNKTQLDKPNQQYRPQDACQNNYCRANKWFVAWFVALPEPVDGHRCNDRTKDRATQVQLPKEHRDHDLPQGAYSPDC